MDRLAAFKESMQIEARALTSFLERVDDRIVQVIDVLQGCRGKIVVTGMGKCGHIGQKIAATFVSTGTPAVFLHPAEAIHGDLGMVAAEDIVLVLSNSGETDEINLLLPHLKRLSAGIVSMTGAPNSTLGRYSSVAVDTRVACEADSLDIAPTASTTLMLAVGDALAAVLMRLQAFSKEDYALYHPGGSLGRSLLCCVDELMHSGDAIPIVPSGTTLRQAILEMSAKRLGCVFIVDGGGQLIGIITDGDLRRLLQQDEPGIEQAVDAVMTCRPRHIVAGTLAAEALRLMEDEKITSLPVLDAENRPAGAIHIHDLVRAGIG